MDPVTLSMILMLVRAAVVLAPEVASLIDRALAGEQITREEIERTQALVTSAADRWNKAGQKPGKE